MKITGEAVEVNEDALRALAQAYDREDAAQRDEPDPWNLDDPGDIGDSDTWVSERLACARAAAEAFLSTLATEPAAPHELSGSAGQLIDRMAKAIRGDTVCDDTPWGALSEDRKVGWRGDAERALAVVKEHLTASHASSPPPKAVTVSDFRLTDTALDWHYDSPAFFAVAHLPNGERIPVDSLREQSRIETAYKAADSAPKAVTNTDEMVEAEK